MRLRAVHFACFMLLLSAIASADARTPRADEQDLHVQYASLLMQHGAAGVALDDAFPCGTAAALKLDLPIGGRAQATLAWSMRPPSAQCARLQDFTGNRTQN